jgi:hypothetical protein
MAFLLSKDLPHNESLLYHKKWQEAWKRYQHYLQAHKSKLPASAKEFALAEWHYNSHDHRCPHDAWLEEVSFREIADRNNSQHRILEIVIRLLGAYHDGYLKLIYKDVLSYNLDLPYRRKKTPFPGKHGDWLVDEITFSPRGKVLHEIEWAENAIWMIECQDIEFKWIAKENQDSTATSNLLPIASNITK